MANSSLAVFEFQSNSVRILSIDNEPWFVARDVCNVLGILNVSQALARLDGDEKRLVNSEGGIISNDDPDVTRLLAVNESGMYSLVLSSRKSEARAFKKWITSEVLPSIRKTGGYVQQELSETEKLRIKLENAKIELEIAKLRLETTKVDVERERFALESKQLSEPIPQFSEIPVANAYSSNAANTIQRAKLINAIAAYMDKCEREHKRIPDIRNLHQRFQRWILITDDGNPIRVNSGILKNLMPEVNACRAERH
jgi:prophage antirepressor-like protein